MLDWIAESSLPPAHQRNLYTPVEIDARRIDRMRLKIEFPVKLHYLESFCCIARWILKFRYILPPDHASFFCWHSFAGVKRKEKRAALEARSSTDIIIIKLNSSLRLRTSCYMNDDHTTYVETTYWINYRHEVLVGEGAHKKYSWFSTITFIKLLTINNK